MMTDAEVIAHARTELDKVRKHGPRAKSKSGEAYVLLEVEVAKRLLDLAEAHVAEGGGPEP